MKMLNKNNKYKILTVDDEIENITFYKSIIENMKCECLTAFNGYEALEILENNQDIELLITDVKMPKMCGKTLVAEINKKYPNHNFKIIMMTAENIEPSFQQANKIQKVLKKPEGFSEIHTYLNNLKRGVLC